MDIEPVIQEAAATTIQLVRGVGGTLRRIAFVPPARKVSGAGSKTATATGTGSETGSEAGSGSVTATGTGFGTVARTGTRGRPTPAARVVSRDDEAPTTCQPHGPSVRATGRRCAVPGHRSS